MQRIISAMEEWRKVPVLDPFERSIVVGFRDAALQDREIFDQKVEEAKQYLTPALVSGLNKAKAFGVW